VKTLGENPNPNPNINPNCLFGLGEDLRLELSQHAKQDYRSTQRSLGNPGIDSGNNPRSWEEGRVGKKLHGCGLYAGLGDDAAQQGDAGTLHETEGTRLTRESDALNEIYDLNGLTALSALSDFDDFKPPSSPSYVPPPHSNGEWDASPYLSTPAAGQVKELKEELLEVA